MHALVAADGQLDLHDVARPSFPQECLIRIRMAGICGTDLAILAGYAGFSGVPGHEFVGVVERAPGDAEAWLGRRVVGEINIGCGLCRSCREGVREHCERRKVVGIRDRDGAFAEYLSLPAENLHAVPDDMTDQVAVFAEPLAAACRIVEQLPHVWRPASAGPPATDAAVLGDGRLGLLVAQVLRHSGARVTVIGRHAEKLAIARGFGVETMTADEVGAAKGRFELVVDATGRPEGLASALTIVRPRGTVVLKSTFHGAVPIATSPIVVDEVTIVGSRCGPFPTAIDLLSCGAVDVRPLITGIYPLSAWRDAFAAARTKLKVLIDMRSQTESTDVRVRIADAKDRAFILGLVPQLVAFGPPAWRDGREMMATDMRVIDDALAGRTDGATVLIAEDARGTPLGFIHLTAEGDYYLQQMCGHVGDIVVAPEARGHGVGRALLTAGEQWAKDRGYRLLTLSVFVQNRGPQALYEKLGFNAETVRYVKRLG